MRTRMKYLRSGRKLALMLVVCMLMGSLMPGSMTAQAEIGIAPLNLFEGHGTAGDPFLISTAEELEYVAGRVNAGKCMPTPLFGLNLT